MLPDYKFGIEVRVHCIGLLFGVGSFIASCNCQNW